MQRKKIGLLVLLSGLTCAAWTVMATEPNESSMLLASSALTGFVQTVVDPNPRVQAARAALEASEAFRSASSRPLYNPELSLDAENTDTDNRTVALSQTIDWSGKRTARTAVAESDRLATEAEYLAVRWAVTIELLSGLASYQTGMARNQLAEERTSLMNEFSRLAKRRFDAGDLNQVELDLATLASVDARLKKATAAADLAEGRQAVRNLTMDLVPAQWPMLPDQTPALPGLIDPKSLVLALPEARATLRRIDAASAVVELRRRERRPDPTISLTGGREDDENLIGLNVSIPLFVRNRFSHEVTAAIAQRDQAQQIANDFVRRALARLVSSAERYEFSQGAWHDWERMGRVSVDRQADQLRQFWESGEISTTDYLVQLRQTLDVKESALDLRQTLWRAWFEWLSASGQVDQWLGIETKS